MQNVHNDTLFISEGTLEYANHLLSSPAATEITRLLITLIDVGQIEFVPPHIASVLLTDCYGTLNPDTFKHIVRLEIAAFDVYRYVQGIEFLERMPNLQSLSLRGVSEPINLQGLQGLTSLTLGRCTHVHAFPAMPNLAELTLEDFSEPINLQGLHGLTSLTLRRCTQLQAIPVMPHLDDLTLDGLSEPIDLQGFQSLASLTIRRCTHFTSFSATPPDLRVLFVSECPDLESIDTIPNSISYVEIRACPKLTSLPNTTFPVLHMLVIKDCPLIDGFDKVPITGLDQGMHTTVLNDLANAKEAYASAAAVRMLRTNAVSRLVAPSIPLPDDVFELIGQFAYNTRW